MDRKLTEDLYAWLNTPANKRDIEMGASFVRRIVRNPILAQNLERYPKNFMAMAEYQLRKFLPARLEESTHEEVVTMTKKVEAIAERNELDKPLPGQSHWKEVTRIAKSEKFSKGKREDHDTLPEEIKALYAENLDLMRQMRHNRAQLLVIMNTKGKEVCPDGDRYPFLKELLRLDAQYRANWKKYDEYSA